MGDLMQYKDVEIPSELSGLINYMTDVEGYREELHNLGNQWDLLTILGQMSGTGTDMTGTRKGFQRLTSELLGQLGLETLKKVVQEIDSKAQVAVDIVIRNLFERTADIGFLATDDDIREFIVEVSITDINSQLGEPGVTADQLEDLEVHAGRSSGGEASWPASTSTWPSIRSTSTSSCWTPRATCWPSWITDNDVKHSSRDPLIQEALTTNVEYVEVFRQAATCCPPLKTSRSSMPTASPKPTRPDSASPGRALSLCFRFENEMEGVFKQPAPSEGDWSVMTLLDKSGKGHRQQRQVPHPPGLGAWRWTWRPSSRWSGSPGANT